LAGSINATLRAAIVGIAPAVLLGALVAHPELPNFGNPGFFAAVAKAVADNPTLWGLAHLTIAVGSGLVVLAFLAVRSYLRKAGEERWSVLGLPFVVIGSVLFAMPPTMELTMVAVAAAGADVASVQPAVVPWFAPILITGGGTYFIGALAFAAGITRSRVLRPRLTWVVVVALLVSATARFAPVHAVQFYVQGAAGIVALWPLTYVMWKHPNARPVGRRQPATEFGEAREAQLERPVIHSQEVERKA